VISMSGGPHSFACILTLESWTDPCKCDRQTTLIFLQLNFPMSSPNRVTVGQSAPAFDCKAVVDGRIKGIGNRCHFALIL
jgi:hypothetical protein